MFKLKTLNFGKENFLNMWQILPTYQMILWKRFESFMYLDLMHQKK